MLFWAFRERRKELQKTNYHEYIDRSLSSIKFIQPRNDLSLTNAYWKLFRTILENKIKKWEEFKFFFTDQSYCKMRLILSYFGEKETQNCGNCSYCNKNKPSLSQITGNQTHYKIINILKQRPCTLEELSILTQILDRHQLLDDLGDLLDDGKIKMLNFRTYTIA